MSNFLIDELGSLLDRTEEIKRMIRTGEITDLCGELYFAEMERGLEVRKTDFDLLRVGWPEAYKVCVVRRRKTASVRVRRHVLV